MFIGRTRELAAVTVASVIALSGAWFYSAQAAPDQTACHRAIALAEDMAETNGELIGVMGARSAALRLGMDDRVAALTPRLAALQADYQQLHARMRAQAAGC